MFVDLFLGHRHGRILWCCFLTLVVPGPHDVDAQDDACTLASLSLRYADWPIDLEPPFRPSVLSYTATLDFAMDFFWIDARSASGCELDGVPQQETRVRIGGSERVTLYSMHTDTGERQAYTVTCTRLLGSETELQALSISGGELSPVFDPTRRSYFVHLGLSHDEVHVHYKLRDNEQRIRSSAQEEHPTGTDPVGLTGVTPQEAPSPPPEGDSSGGSGGGGPNSTSGQSNATAGGGAEGESDARRLEGAEPRERSSGEVQYRGASDVFMLDIGFTRTVQLTVQCADATQANIGAYRLDVSRPGCTHDRPYYDPSRRNCVNFCPSGFYRNEETHRCSQCNINCRVCSGLLECQMCEPDTADYNFVVQPDGSCDAVANHLFKKYRWWCAGLAILLSFLVLIGCAGICQFCCSGSGSSGSDKSKGRQVRTYDSEFEDSPPHDGKRRLGMY